MATDVGIKELLEAGVHFGHQTRRWNPKMRRFIFGERGGIHIIDLQKTERLLHNAQEFAGDLAGRGGTVLFVGTKKQARDTIREGAESCGMPYVNQRWLGGLLTNFQTISKRIRRLHELREWTESGSMDLLPVRERIASMAERDKLETNLGGVADMQRPPDAMFVVDLKTEAIGVREADASEDPGHRARRHQLRPRPGRLRDPGQRRRDPVVPRRDQRDRGRGRRALDALPCRGGGSAARARGAGAPRGRGARAARGRRSASSRRPRSAPAARPRRQASRQTSPPRRAAPGPRRPAAPARLASAARSIPTTIPRGARS